MTDIITNDSTEWPVGTTYVTKEQWASYVNHYRQDNCYEDLGYLDATEAMVEKLEATMQINDQDKFRAAVKDLIENRRELLNHAFGFMNSEIPKTDYEISLSFKP